MTIPFTLAATGQRGRVGFEAILLASSVRQNDPGFDAAGGALRIMEPQPGPLWPNDPRMTDAQREALEDLGAEIVPFESRHFGASYPQGNKMEGLAALPRGPALFLDSDTLVTGPIPWGEIDWTRPTASMNRSGTFPNNEELYGPTLSEIWGSLYDLFALDMATSLDTAWPEDTWQRHLYFNAGWVVAPDAPSFGARWAEMAVHIRDETPTAAQFQSFDPWLDQVALPLAVHEAGGGRPGPELAPLDGGATCHWRALPLLYASGTDDQIAKARAAAAPNKVKKVLKDYEPFKRFLYQNRGDRARALFAEGLPRKERAIRNALKRANLWMR